MSSVELIITDTENATKYIGLIRRETKVSISEIRNNIINHKAVVSCDYIDSTERLESLLYLIDTLEEKGAQLEIIQNFGNIMRIINKEVIKNLIDSDKIINNQIQLIKDQEVDE